MRCSFVAWDVADVLATVAWPTRGRLGSLSSRPGMSSCEGDVCEAHRACCIRKNNTSEQRTATPHAFAAAARQLVMNEYASIIDCNPSSQQLFCSLAAGPVGRSHIDCRTCVHTMTAPSSRFCSDSRVSMCS